MARGEIPTEKYLSQRRPVVPEVDERKRARDDDRHQTTAHGDARSLSPDFANPENNFNQRDDTDENFDREIRNHPRNGLPWRRRGQRFIREEDGRRHCAWDSSVPTSINSLARRCRHSRAILRRANVPRFQLRPPRGARYRRDRGPATLAIYHDAGPRTPSLTIIDGGGRQSAIGRKS